MVEEVNCDLCRRDAPSPLFKRKDRFSGQEYQIVSCSNCGFIYLNPRPSPEELPEHYPSDYEAYYLLNDHSSSRNQWHLQRALNLQLNFIQQYASSRGRLLDVGCATGNFLKVGRDNGWQVVGVEPIEEAAKIAREYYQLNVFTGTLDSVDLDDDSFDAITMWDVLEHLPSPTNALVRSHHLLKPDGLLVFSIPNLSSFDRYLFGKHWIGWDAPRHFNLFTEESLTQLLEKTGFKLLARKCIIGGKGTFLLSMDNFIKDKKLGSIVKSSYPVISALLWPYRQISYLLKRGPIITYAIQKKGD